MARTCLTPLLSLIVPAFCLSCSTTDVIDSDFKNTPDSNVISLSLSAPEISTRADNSHKLRYTATLIQGDITATGATTTVKQSQQMIEGEEGNTIVFEGVEEGTYSILLFADYIPVDSQKDANGFYPDAYYTVIPASSSPAEYDKISLKEAGRGIINNDHYDCFGKCLVVEKDAEEKHEIVSLNRVVAKVRFVANSPAGEDVTSVKLQQYSVNRSFKLSTRSAGDIYSPTISNNNPMVLTPTDIANNELFYVYTFATDPANAITDGKSLGEFKFTVSAGDLDDVVTTIRSGDILVRPNVITTVKGDYLPQKPDDPVIRNDRIILDMSVINDWDSE